MASFSFVTLSVVLLVPALAVTPADLASFLYSSSDGPKLGRREADILGEKEAPTFTQCRVTVDDLKPLWKVLYSSLSGGFGLGKSKAVDHLFPIARQHLNPKHLTDMREVLYSNKWANLNADVAFLQSIELVKVFAEPAQLMELWNFLYLRSGVGLSKDAAKVAFLELASAGCDVVAIKNSFFARTKAVSKEVALKEASDSAVRAFLNGEEKRYGMGGAQAYTASEFQEYYGEKYMAEWLASPLEKKVANDGKAYAAREFRKFYGGSWEQKWEVGTPATQMRVAEDGKAYTLQEFVQYFEKDWQENWFKACDAPCKECHGRDEL